MNEPGETGQVQSGPGFENALRACLVTGVVLVDAENGLATVTPEACRILGLSPDQAQQIPVEALPAPLAEIAREALISGKPSATRQVTVAAKEASLRAFVNAIPLQPN